MYSNGVRVPYVNRINQEGYLPHSNWVWNGSESSYSRGEAIFRGECGSCHTMDGYRPMRQLLSGRDRSNIGSFITMLARLQARHALQALHATDGGHAAGCE